MRRTYLIYALLFLVTYAGSLAYLKPVIATAYVDAKTVQTPSFIQRVTNEITPASVRQVTNTMPVTGVAQQARQVDNQIQSEPEQPDTPLIVDYASPDRVLRKLTIVAQDDERAENRMAAVRALHVLADNGDANGRILGALRMATTDADAEVAAAARAAYQEVRSRCTALIVWCGV